MPPDDYRNEGTPSLSEVPYARGEGINRQQPLPQQVMSGGLAQLLAGSTVWPNLLLLRLRLENGRVRTIPVLPDSVSRETFRALQVACRWVASHNNDA